MPTRTSLLREPPLPLQLRVEGAALEVLQQQVDVLAVLEQSELPHQPRRLEVTLHFRLQHELLHHQVAADRSLGDLLQREDDARLDVDRHEDHPETALPQLLSPG